MQEFRTGATRGAMDAIHSKEETTRLRTQIGDLRNKLGELENKVSRLQFSLNAKLLFVYMLLLIKKLNN